MKIDPLQLIKELNKYPVQDVIPLELNRVGTKSGIDFEFLARAVELSEHDILCGGGVRNCEDVYKMKEIGVKGALVATAVHDGGIPVLCIHKKCTTEKIIRVIYKGPSQMLAIRQKSAER